MTRIRQQPNPLKPLVASGHESKIRILPYALIALLLLLSIALWIFYQQYKYVPVSTQNFEPVAALQANSAVAAASAVTETIAALPATASGTEDTAKQSWTHPATPKKRTHHRRKLPESGRLATADPLQEGYLALSLGNLDLAEQKYQAVLVRHPHEKDALLGLAVIAQRNKQTDRAAGFYRQVLREDMGNAAAAAGLVSLSEQADPVAAESQLRELLDIKPAAPELHYALGGVLAREQRWGEAQQAFYRAYTLAPANALYAYNLAVSLDRLHQTAPALSYYKTALSLAASGNTTLNQDAIGRRIQELGKTN